MNAHPGHSLHSQLLRSHLAVSTFGLIALGVAFVVTLWLRSYSVRLAEVRGPSVHHSMRIMAGVQTSLAALRGWIVLGDEAFKQERSAAWREDITPALRDLQTLPEQAGRLEQLQAGLIRLKESQWWIEDTAQTPGNEPARVMLAHEIEPVADVIRRAASSCIDLEKSMPGSERLLLLAAWADLRSSFAQCQAALRSYVFRSSPVDDRFQTWMNELSRQLVIVDAHHSVLSAEQRHLHALIAEELDAYNRLASQLVTKCNAPQWNLARHRLESEAAPIARELTAILREITNTNSELMRQDARSVTMLSAAALATLVALMLGMSIVAIVFSGQRARQLAAPIAKLMAATQRLAENELAQSIEVTSKNELGVLAHSFNRMRTRLSERTQTLAKTQADLARQEQRLQATIRSAPIAMVMVNASGQIVLTNRAAEELFGYTRDEMVGQPVELLLPARFRDNHPSQRDQYFADLSARPMAAERELFGRHKDGREIPVEIGLSPIETEDETLALSVISDITERLLAESALRESREQALQASTAKSEFLANMSHEIRTPMNAILGLTDLVLENDLDEVSRDYLQTVSTSAQSLLEIIDEILDFSKIEAGKLALDLREFQLHDLVGDTLKSLALKAHGSNLELTCRIGSKVPAVVVGDASRVRQVLVNLVGNAIKFTHEGQVAVEVSLETPSSNDEETVQVRFSVADTGIGIEPEKLTKIFGAFEQADSTAARKYGGTGLGLTISARLADSMQGRVWAQSTPGCGSTFYFTATFGRTSSKPRQPWQEALDELCGVRLLIVDDNDTNRLILKEIVESQGLRSGLAAAAHQGLEQLKDAQAQNDPYRVVLSDVNMPDVDGFEFSESIRRDEKLYRTPIILLSSSGDMSEMSRIKGLDISARLMKPVKQSELCEVIVRTLGLAKEVDPDVPAAVGSHDVSIPQLRVLLAEDSVPNQKLALALLGNLGHTTVVAATGREAVAAVQLQPFDLVLMDVQMPEMDGFAATAAIRAWEEGTDRHIPIVAMTAHALKGDCERCLKAGMDAYLAKPVRPHELTTVLQDVFGVPLPTS